LVLTVIITVINIINRRYDCQLTFIAFAVSGHLLLFTAGIGNFAGNLFCGIIMDACTDSRSSVNYHVFWLVPSVSLFIMLFVMMFFLKNPPLVAKN